MIRCNHAKPEFFIGQMVSYMDHHKRWQTGRVKRIDASWNNYGRPDDVIEPHITYTVEHPTYRNRVMYTGTKHGHMKEVTK